MFFCILRLYYRASWQILIIKKTRCTNFSNLFWIETLHVSDSFFVHHQEFFNVHTAMLYVFQVCWQLSSRIRMEQSSILILHERCLQTWITYTIDVQSVKNSWWTKELSETCIALFQNKFEKLLHQINFIISIFSCVYFNHTRKFYLFFIRKITKYFYYILLVPYFMMTCSMGGIYRHFRGNYSLSF